MSNSVFRKFLFRIRNEGILGTLLPLSSNRLAKILYRTSSVLNKFYIPELPFLLCYINAVVNGCEIHYRAKIGKGLSIAHSRGIVVGRDVVIGKNLKIYSGVVIGKKNKSSGMPTIGDNVTIGAGATIVGDIKIGNNVKIGANSMIYNDIPDNSLVTSPKSESRIVSHD